LNLGEILKLDLKPIFVDLEKSKQNKILG